MQELVNRILDFHELQSYFRDHDHFVMRVQPPRPNELEVRKRASRVFVGEATNPDYWLIRQDMTYSPEMEFEVSDDGLWIPTYLKEPHQAGRRSIEYVDGCRQVREVRHRNQIRFTKNWCEKLMARDYHQGLLRHFQAG